MLLFFSSLNKNSCLSFKNTFHYPISSMLLQRSSIIKPQAIPVFLSRTLSFLKSYPCSSKIFNHQTMAVFFITDSSVLQSRTSSSKVLNPLAINNSSLPFKTLSLIKIRPRSTKIHNLPGSSKSRLSFLSSNLVHVSQRL